MTVRRSVAAALVFLAAAAAAFADAPDPLDDKLALLVTGKGDGPSFYKALLEAPLFAVADGASEGSRLVLAHREQDGVKIIDVYTSEAQAALAPPAARGKTVRLQGRELFQLIQQTGCDIGLNSFSGHGARILAAKIAQILKG